MKLSFAQFDCKDIFWPVFPSDKHGGYIDDFRSENCKVLSRANDEYLERIKALQREIVAEYEPKLIDGPADNDDGDVTISEVYDQMYYT